MQYRTWLIIGGALSAIAALAHLAVIAGGPDWYRFCGAGEGMARAAARGELRPALITIGIAAILFVWAAYAFSGAGLIPRLPLLRTGLVTISAVYLLRALAPAALLLFRPWLMSPFVWWSSAIVLVYGLAYAIGTYAAWPRLSGAG
jgi:hypothetical protein